MRRYNIPMRSIGKMRCQLERLARQAWNCDHIFIFLNGSGITVYPKNQPDQRVNFQSFVNGERRDAYADAIDYFRAETLICSVPLDFDWDGYDSDGTEGGLPISPIGEL